MTDTVTTLIAKWPLRSKVRENQQLQDPNRPRCASNPTTLQLPVFSLLDRSRFNGFSWTIELFDLTLTKEDQ